MLLECYSAKIGAIKHSTVWRSGTLTKIGSTKPFCCMGGATDIVLIRLRRALFNSHQSSGKWTYINDTWGRIRSFSLRNVKHQSGVLCPNKSCISIVATYTTVLGSCIGLLDSRCVFCALKAFVSLTLENIKSFLCSLTNMIICHRLLHIHV